MGNALTERLLDPSRSNAALLALLVKGRTSVPLLVEFLRATKPSTVAEARLLAVEGLSVLKGPEALDALIEVATERLEEIADPAVRLAEESVCSYAARALAEFSDPRARVTLQTLLGRKPLLGVAEAFEKLADPEALPHLVWWLEEDFVAEAAGRAIAASGRLALPILLESLRQRRTRDGSETPASRRRRARIVNILGELAEPAELSAPEELVSEPDEAVRWKAAQVLVRHGNKAQKRRAFPIALGLLDSSDNRIRAECETLLTEHFESGSDWIEQKIRKLRESGESEKALAPRETTLEILLRIRRTAHRRAEVNP